MYEHSVKVQNSTNIINRMATQAGTVLRCGRECTQRQLSTEMESSAASERLVMGGP